RCRPPLSTPFPYTTLFRSRGAGIALAASASAKLIVNAACFVAFCAENKETTRGRHLIVLFISLGFVAIENLVPLIRGNNVFVAGDRKSTRLNSSHQIISYA